MKLVDKQTEEVNAAAEAAKGSELHGKLAARRTDRNTLIDGAKTIIAASATREHGDRNEPNPAQASRARLGNQRE